MNIKLCDLHRIRWAHRLLFACLSAALVLLAPLTAQGLSPIEPARVCRALVDEKPIHECQLAIDRVPVDPLAAGACLRLKINYPVSMCMRTIAGMQYSPEDIADCDELTDVWQTLLCFYNKGRRVAQRNFSGTYADQICMRLNTPRQVQLCVAGFQEAYMQPSAALACDRLPGSARTIDCLYAIMNQRYSEAEVATCDELRSSADTISCFKRELGGSGSISKEPAAAQYYNGQPAQGPQPYYNSPPTRQRPPYYYPPAGGSGGCNSYGCYGPGGGCNSYGCYTAGGGCNSYGCWHSRQGSCNSYGCTAFGQCNSYGCPKLR